MEEIPINRNSGFMVITKRVLSKMRKALKNDGGVATIIGLRIEADEFASKASGRLQINPLLH
jgi:hypothetical protein